MGTLVVASIVMPVGRVHDFILPAVESVLQQSFEDLELIVVDDSGQRDRLETALQNLINDKRVKIISCLGKGISDALNTGTDAATGRFWFRCDSDDLYPDDRVASQIDFLETHPEFGVVTGAMTGIDTDGKFVGNMNRHNISQEITDELRKGITRSSLCSWAIHIELIRSSGRFRRYFTTAEDIDLQLRIGEQCRVWYDASVRYQYRLHDSSITQLQPATRLGFFDTIARDFQQQRLAGGKDSLDLGNAPPPPARESARSGRNRIQELIMGTAWDQHRNGKKLHALQSGFRALSYGPLKLKGWRNLAAIAIKPTPKPSGNSASGQT